MELAAAEAKLALRKERAYVVILAAIQIAHVLDFVIMMPLGPQFMRVFDINPSQFSALVAAYTFSAGLVGFFGALFADRFDRKNFLLFNFLGFILGTFLCGVSSTFGTLLAARIIAGAFGGVLNACVLALVADLIPYERRGAAMGVVMSAFSIASVVGVPIGLYIADVFNWQAAFFFICVVGAVFWLASFFILPPVPSAQVASDFRANLREFRRILREPDYLRSFILTSVLGFGVFSIVPFISPYMVKNVGMLESQLPLIYLVGGVCTVTTARIIGMLCDRLGSFRVFKYTASISVVPIILMTHIPAVSLPLMLAVTSLFMMFGTARFIPAMTIVSAVVKPGERGTFMSLENAGRQFSSGLASQLAGLIIGATAAGTLTNFHLVGYVAVVTSLVSIWLAYGIKRKFNLR